jgi:hypothetical protein
MADWDITTISLVLVGCSIIAAGIIIAIVLLGYLHTFAPFPVADRNHPRRDGGSRDPVCRSKIQKDGLMRT